MHLAIELMALAVYGPLLVLLHELGHAVFARRGGYRVTSFAVGLGRPMWSLYLRDGVVLHVDRWFFAGGACTAVPTGPPGRRRAWFHAGGFVAQAVLAVVLLLLPPSWLSERILWFDLWVALTNAIPWRLGSQASDGWHLLDALTGAHRAGTVVAQRASLARMAAREEAAGSPVGTAWCDVCLAWSAVQLGETEQARRLLEGRGADATRLPWLDALFHVVQAEIHRVEARPLGALAVLHEAAQLELDAPGRALLRCAEARAWIDAGAPERARGVLGGLAGATGPLAHQAMGVWLWSQLDGETADLELAVWHLERRRGEGWLDPLDAVQALRAAAEELDTRGRRPAARGARRTADRLMERTLLTLDEVDARQARMHVGDSLWHASEGIGAGSDGDRPKEERSTDRI